MLNHEQYENLLHIAAEYEHLYHLSLGFEQIEDKDYEHYMAILTELNYYQELTERMEMDQKDFFYELGINLYTDPIAPVQLQPFELFNPTDVSLGQEYFFYYYVGNGDRQSAEFREVVFQDEWGTFEWKMEVADGQGARTNLAIYPHGREDSTIYFDIYANKYQRYAHIDCQHDQDCSGSKQLGAWNLDYAIDLASSTVSIVVTLTDEPAFYHESKVNYFEQNWNTTLYMGEEEIFNKEWN